MHDQARQRPLYIVDFDDGAIRQPDHARVGELSTTLGVERCAVENDLDLLTGSSGRDRLAVDEHATHLRLTASLVVSGELNRLADRLEHRAIGRDVDRT